MEAVRQIRDEDGWQYDHIDGDAVPVQPGDLLRVQWPDGHTEQYRAVIDPWLGACVSVTYHRVPILVSLRAEGVCVERVQEVKVNDAFLDSLEKEMADRGR